MIQKFKAQIAIFLALLFALGSCAAEADTDVKEQRAKLQFVRSNGKLAVIKARIEVNGKRIAEIGKGESGEVLIESGRTLVKIDSSYAPGQMTFSFLAEKGGEYRFDVFDSVDKMDAAHLFGSPPKAANGEVLESNGLLKATLFSAKLPAPPKPELAPVAQMPKLEVSLPQPIAAVDKPALPIKDQLQELKKLFEQDLISKEIYQEKQKKILEGL
jgi:hypothetical protein